MKIIYFIVFVSILLLTGCGAASLETAPADFYAFRDDTGTEIVLSEPPQTAAILTSSLADLWITAGGRIDITVGETIERGFADEDSVLVDDGAGKTINLELLIASKPDLVLYAADLSGQAECAAALTEAGIPAAGFTVETFDDYLHLLKICTDILDTPEIYQKHGLDLKQKVNDLIALAGDQEVRPSILFVRAGSGVKYTKAKTAENHFVCVMLNELGTYNIAEKNPVLLDGLSTEEILISDPDFIFFTTMGDEHAGLAYMESLFSDPVWQSMTAVKNKQVYQLPKDLFQYKPNSRWDQAYAYLIQLLYGDIL